MIERLSKNAGKLISARIISEINADMYMNFQSSMILVNVATTLFPGILFQLFFPCILLNSGEALSALIDFTFKRTDFVKLETFHRIKNEKSRRF